MARASNTQVAVYLLGHALLVAGFTFFTVGFATDHWMEAGGFNYGLWRYCGPYACQTTGNLSSWLLATRAMQTMALMLYMLAFLLAIASNCLEQTSAHHGYSGKETALEILGTTGTVFCIIGVSVFGAKADNTGTLQYSYALTVFSIFLIIPGLVSVAVTRNAVRSSKGVSPHPAEVSSAGTTAVVIGQSQPGPAGGVNQPQSSAGYSYGYGQHQRPRGSISQSHNTPNYGNNDSRGVALNPATLPYSMHPEGPASSGRRSPAQNHYPMPQPEPVPPSQRDGGGRGGDFGQDHGHYPMPQPEPVGGRVHGDFGQGEGHPQGRLPPISAPSAPPDDDEAPPSYMEAIGAGRR